MPDATTDAPALDRTQATDVRVPELSYFFPAHDEAENVEALVVEALARAAPHGRALRDHLRRRRQPRRHGADRRPPGGRAPRRRARRPPRRQPGLRRRGPLRAGLGALPARLLHRRRPTVPRRGPGLPAGAPGGRGDPPAQPRTSWSAIASAVPTRPSGWPTRASTGPACASSSVSPCATPTAPASSSGAGAGGRARRVGWCLPFRGAAHQDQPARRPHRRAGRAALPPDGRAGLRGGPARGRSSRARLLGAAPAALGRPRAALRRGAPSCPTRPTPRADPRSGATPGCRRPCRAAAGLTGHRAPMARSMALRQPGSPPPGRARLVVDRPVAGRRAARRSRRPRSRPRRPAGQGPPPAS